MSGTNVAAMPSREIGKPLKEVASLGEAFNNAEFMQRIKQSVPRHLSPDRMLRTFVQAVSKTPLLMQCEMRSVLGAMLTCSQVGLEPNTPLGHAYLIPFKGRAKRGSQWVDIYEVQLIFGYAGLLDLSYRSKALTSVHADVVWPGADFSFEYGTNAHVKHIPRSRRDDGQPPEWAYMHAVLTQGQAFEVLPWDEVMRIRNGSQGFQAALRAKNKAEESGTPLPKAWTEAPWVKHEIAMARKTAFRSGSKWLPRSIELASVLQLDEAQDNGRVDFGAAFAMPTVDGKADYLDGALDGADHGDPAGAFGVRQQNEQQGQQQPQDNRPQQTEQRTAEAQREEPSVQQQAPQQQRQAAPPAFDAYLCDEFGELLTDAGDGGHFTDPGRWVLAFAELLPRTQDRAMLVENNGPTIEDIEANHPAVARHLHAVLDDASDPATAAAPVAVPVPQKNGKPDLTGYIGAMQIAAGKQTAEGYDAWWAVNRPAYAKMPPVTRKAIDKALADRRDVLGLSKPPAQQQALQQAEQQQDQRPAPPDEDPADPGFPGDAGDAPAEDADQAFAAGLMGDIMATKTLDALNSLSNAAVRTKVAGLKERRPDLYDQIVKAGEDKAALLKGNVGGGR